MTQSDPIALPTLPQWLAHPDFVAIMRALHHDSGSAYIVGGVVRDLLRGTTSLESLPPDVDVACTQLPQAAMQEVAGAGYDVIPTGIAHGTFTVVLHESRIEITTMRRDRACDGRHATVEFGSDMMEDALRRDFTMNALYLAPDGMLHDPIGGASDAREGYVRFIADAETRIREDALRMLRFYRFHAQLGSGNIDATGQVACSKHAGLLARISGERIQQEMKKLLQQQAPYAALVAMQQAGIFHEIALPNNSLDVMVLLQAYHQNWLVRLSGFFRENDDADALIKRWRLSNADSAVLRLLVQHSLAPEADALAHKQWIYQHGHVHYAMMCARVAAHTGSTSMLETARTLANWQIPTFPVNAADLQAQGLQGKALGERLKHLESEWMKSDFSASKAELVGQI